MEMILIEIGSPEWDYIWDYVKLHPLSKDIENPTIALNNGEVWAYMGSWRQGIKVLHTIRHRNHPTTNSVQTLTFKASSKLTDEQINKRFNI